MGLQHYWYFNSSNCRRTFKRLITVLAKISDHPLGADEAARAWSMQSMDMMKRSPTIQERTVESLASSLGSTTVWASA